MGRSGRQWRNARYAIVLIWLQRSLSSGGRRRRAPRSLLSELTADVLPFLPCDTEVALEREVEGDLFLADIGQGFPFRPGSFDGAISYAPPPSPHSPPNLVQQRLRPPMALQCRRDFSLPSSTSLPLLHRSFRISLEGISSRLPILPRVRRPGYVHHEFCDSCWIRRRTVCRLRESKLLIPAKSSLMPFLSLAEFIEEVHPTLSLSPFHCLTHVGTQEEVLPHPLRRTIRRVNLEETPSDSNRSRPRRSRQSSLRRQAGEGSETERWEEKERQGRRMDPQEEGSLSREGQGGRTEGFQVRPPSQPSIT